MPVSSRESTVSVRPFQIRAAVGGDMDQLCELAAQLLTNIRAEGTTKDAQRVFDYIMNSGDRGLIVGAENKQGTLVFLENLRELDQLWDVLRTHATETT